MVYWFYDRKDLKCTPSVQDSILLETEMRYRKEGARFIMDLGNKIGLRYDTVATGVVFMHRFYMFHSFKEFDRYVTACCCLFLAGKVEETPKKAKDIIKQAKTLLPDSKFAAFGADPKEEVMTMERILLQTIKFDLQVDHPYTYLIKYAKCLKGDKAKLHKCVQMAWTFDNDSLCTTLCLQWEPEIIAIALMYLAGKLSKFEVVDWVGRQPHHLRWWDMFVEDISMELLEDVCHQVLDLYTQAKVGAETTDSPPPTVSSAVKAEPAESTPQGPTAVPVDTTPKKRATPPTPPSTAPKAADIAAPAPAPAAAAAVAVAAAAGGFGYGSAAGDYGTNAGGCGPAAAGYGFSYPPPSEGAVRPPPPAAVGPAPPPPAPVGAAAQFASQYPSYGYSSGEGSSPVAAPPPPPPPSSKYAAPPPPPGPAGGLPPGPPPPRHAFPPGAAPPPPAARGYFAPQGGPPPGYRPGGPPYPPGHRPF